MFCKIKLNRYIDNVCEISQRHSLREGSVRTVYLHVFFCFFFFFDHSDMFTYSIKSNSYDSCTKFYRNVFFPIFLPIYSNLKLCECILHNSFFHSRDVVTTTKWSFIAIITRSDANTTRERRTTDSTSLFFIACLRISHMIFHLHQSRSRAGIHTLTCRVQFTCCQASANGICSIYFRL